MSSNPKISIVTPSYAQGHFLEETIDSVLSQGYDNLEYIIIDGGSKDESVEIIKKYERHLAYWVSEPDQGQSHAINKGLAKCTGDIFNWLNSDDYYEPNCLSHVGFVYEKTKFQVYGGIGRVFDTHGTKYVGHGTDVYPELAKTLGRARIDQPETFWDLDTLCELLPLREDLNYLMDRDLWVRFLLKYGQDRVVRDDELLVHFRHHNESKTVSAANLFNYERDAYFRALASHLGRDLSALPEHFAQASSQSLDWKIDISQSEAKKAIDHYLLLLAEEAYGRRHMKSCAQILRLINQDVIQGPDAVLLKKITQRSGATQWLWRK